MKFDVEPSAATWAWLAGLFEAQGTAAYHRTARRRVRLQFKFTDEDVVRLLHARIGGKVFGPYQYRYRDGVERKAFWLWVSDGLDPQELAAEMWPWLGERRRSRLTEFDLGPGQAAPGPRPNAAPDSAPA